ncbi:MAG: hypothetical protein C5B58_16015 [Acidobacteria bacterium]|nr:MAG: hypothetical protein C5B58_16015 [Acidobacteriota bacterium]
MVRKSQGKAIYYTSTVLVDQLGLSWYRFYRLLKLGIIPSADAIVNGRPVWLRERVNEIDRRIDEL